MILLFFFYSQNVSQNVSQNEIYQIIKYNPYVTRAEIAKKLGKKFKTIARYLKSMSNIIRYIGSSKNGMWIITSK